MQKLLLKKNYLFFFKLNILPIISCTIKSCALSAIFSKSLMLWITSSSVLTSRFINNFQISTFRAFAILSNKAVLGELLPISIWLIVDKSQSALSANSACVKFCKVRRYLILLPIILFNFPDIVNIMTLFTA